MLKSVTRIPLYDLETEQNMFLLQLDRNCKVSRRWMRWNSLYCLLLAGCIFLAPCGLVGGFRRFRWECKLLETPHYHTPTGCSISSSINLYALYHLVTWGGSFNRRDAIGWDVGRIKILLLDQNLIAAQPFHFKSLRPFSSGKAFTHWSKKELSRAAVIPSTDIYLEVFDRRQSHMDFIFCG